MYIKRIEIRNIKLLWIFLVEHLLPSHRALVCGVQFGKPCPSRLNNKKDLSTS